MPFSLLAYVQDQELHVSIRTYDFLIWYKWNVRLVSQLRTEHVKRQVERQLPADIYVNVVQEYLGGTESYWKGILSPVLEKYVNLMPKVFRHFPNAETWVDYFEPTRMCCVDILTTEIEMFDDEIVDVDAFDYHYLNEYRVRIRAEWYPRHKMRYVLQYLDCGVVLRRTDNVYSTELATYRLRSKRKEPVLELLRRGQVQKRKREASVYLNDWMLVNDEQVKKLKKMKYFVGGSGWNRRGVQETRWILEN
jgi:hypothetical protein